MGFLGGMAGGLASRAMDRKKKDGKKPDFKNSPLGKLASTVKKHLPSYKRGGTVKKTGPAIVHKGEKILPARIRKKKLSSGLKPVRSRIKTQRAKRR